MATSTVSWQKTYPTPATVADASLETLEAWATHLPLPQTDVERTVQRRIKARRDLLVAKSIREKTPEIADKFNRMYGLMDKLGIKHGHGRM